MQKIEYKKKCKVCGKDFSTTRDNKQTCSRECAKKGSPSRQPKITFKTCVVCGTVFIARRAALTCSPECSKARKKLYMDNYERDNKEELKAKAKTRYDLNRDKHLSYNKEYRSLHKEELAEKNKDWRANNIASIKQKRHDKAVESSRNKRRERAMTRQELIKNTIPVDKPVPMRAGTIPDERWESCNLDRVGLGTFKCLRCGKTFYEDYTHMVDFTKAASIRNVCPHCSDYPYGITRVSGPEIEIQKLFPEFSIMHWRPEWLGGKELDLYAPEFNIALEYDGVKWHSGLTKAERKEVAKKHIEKTNLCEQHGIQLIHLFETEWLYRRECVIDKLSAIFHRPMERFMARKCYTEVADSGEPMFKKTRDEIREFLDKNHIQKAGMGGTCRVMLRDKGTKELRAVCCFQNRHGRSKTTADEWDLCRYATTLGTSVAGGITKCIAAFKQKHPECTTLTSLADRRWTSHLRSAYASSGFVWDGGEPKADYFYIVKKDNEIQLVNKSTYQLKFIDEEFPGTFIDGADNTEWARMERAGIPYIYDCGKIKYVMKL